MSIQPRGESLRRAIRFVSGKLQDDPDQALQLLVNEATLQFDLDPAQAEYLTNFYREASARGSDEPD